MVCYALFNVNRKRGMRGLRSKTGFVQHLNYFSRMTNPLKDYSSRDGNLWWGTLPFRELFLMLKSGLVSHHFCLAVPSFLALLMTDMEDTWFPSSLQQPFVLSMTAGLSSDPSFVSEHPLLNPFQTPDWSYCTSLISFQLGTAFCLHIAPATTCCSS